MSQKISTPQHWLRRLRRSAGELAFERRIGIRTSGRLDPDELGYSDDRLQAYEPASWRTLHDALPKRSVSEEDVFIDLGSGMGRMVLRAAEYPFKRVIGVEMSPKLHEIAAENLAACRSRLRCSEVDLVCSDVLDYEFPDDLTHVFVYNSFKEEIFDQAMEKVFASWDRNPRRLCILYRNPTEHERLMRSGRVIVAKVHRHSIWRGWPRTVTMRTYEVCGARSR